MAKFKLKRIRDRVGGLLCKLERKERAESWMKGVKGYMIDTFLFFRLLNPKIVKNFQKIFAFRQEFEVWCYHHSSNLTSVETKWSHEFIKEFRHFSVHTQTSTASLGMTFLKADSHSLVHLYNTPDRNTFYEQLLNQS
jgi:hypothetical protein